MEEATITSINNTDMIAKEPFVRDRFPTVVDTDDLILELGKKEVDRLNKEKLLEGLLKQKQAMQDTIAIIQVELPKLQTEIKSLKESNAKYEANNRTIADSLSDIRTKYVKEQEEHNRVKIEKDKLQADVSSVSTSFNELQDKYNKEAVENENNKKLIIKLQEEAACLNEDLTTFKSLYDNLTIEKKQLEELLISKSTKKK